MSLEAAIIIPTYSGHLEQVSLFLESYKKFCLDKNSHQIFLVISSQEEDEFNNLLEQLKMSESIKIVTLKKILFDLEKKEINESKLLKEIGKFNFQAIKKLYGAKYAAAETSLILDSEALLVRKMKFGKVFSDYLQSPFVFYSPYFANQMQQEVTYLSCQILGKQSINKWFLETQYWFFQKDILDALFVHVKKTTKKSIFGVLKEYKSIFPEIFYFVYAYYFHPKKLQWVNAEKLLAAILPLKTYLKYRSLMVENTIFEYFSWGLRKENSPAFEKILQKFKIHFFKYDDRWQLQENTRAQQQLIATMPSIYLLPCRVVTKSFKIEGVTIPKNHDPDSNEPILNSTRFISAVRKKIVGIEAVKWAHQTYVGWSENRKVQRGFSDISKKFDEHGSIALKYSKKPRKPSLNQNLAFDVGSFVGNSIDRLRSLGYEKIVCFEPSRRNFVHLYQNFQSDPDISYIHRAVSDKDDETVTFYSNQFLPWLNTLHSDWLEKTRHAPDVKNITSASIQTTTLDTIIRLTGEIPGYIKIDTEGHEYAALQGLSYKSAMLSFEWISEREKSILLCLEKCAELGFRKFFVELRETVPEFNPKDALSLSEAKKYIIEICTNDTQNNLGGNIWCQ